MKDTIFIPALEGRLKKDDLIFVVIVSVIFHVLLFFLILFFPDFNSEIVNYSPPKTFELITVNRSSPKISAKKVSVKKQKKVTKKNNFKKEKHISKKNEINNNTEDLKELEELKDLLDEQTKVSSLNAGDFKYQWYLNNIQSRVENYWKPPKGKYNKEVVIEFIIDKNGKISFLKIAKSSGNMILDNMAKRAITLAAPFGKLPPAYKSKLKVLYTLYPYSK